jgi:hypothetical protein
MKGNVCSLLGEVQHVMDELKFHYLMLITEQPAAVTTVTRPTTTGRPPPLTFPPETAGRSGTVSGGHRYKRGKKFFSCNKILLATQGSA